MSYGTMIYPKLEDFPKYNSLSEDEITSNIDSEVRFITNKLSELRALILCTPYNVFGDKAYERMRDLVYQYFDEIIESYIIKFELESVLDLKGQEDASSEDDAIPYLYFKNFSYPTKWVAEADYNDNLKALAETKGKVLGLCLATPIDVTPKSDERYSDGYQEPIYYLMQEFNCIEDAIDDYLEHVCTSKLIIKFWDGHEEG